MKERLKIPSYITKKLNFAPLSIEVTFIKLVSINVEAKYRIGIRLKSKNSLLSFLFHVVLNTAKKISFISLPFHKNIL